jgi:hypothetical protein
MRFNFIAWTAVAIVAYVPGVLSTPINLAEQSPSNHLSSRAIALTGACQGDWAVAIDWAKDEAADMIDYVIPRFQQLLANMEATPVPSKVSMNPADRTVFQTYEAFFGQLYFDGKTVTARKQNDASKKRLRDLIATAQRVQRALRNPAAYNVEIWCNDDFVWPQQDGSQYDGRRWTLQNPVGSTVSLQTCAQSPSTKAYTYQPSSPPFLGETVIVLCKGHLGAWTQRYLSSDNVKLFHDNRQLPANQYRMDHLWGYLPATLLHELTHARNIMGNNGLVDKELMDKTPVYQWDAISRLAKENPEAAIGNSDSFSLFTTAIYMNKNDWSTGVGQNLGFVPLGRRSDDVGEKHTVSRGLLGKPRKMRGDKPQDLAAKAYAFSTKNMAAFQKSQNGKPPAGKPPVGKPPVGKPPVGKPPVGKPPVGKPPVGKPPVGKPPVGKPPVGKPPVGKPPVGKPPKKGKGLLGGLFG